MNRLRNHQTGTSAGRPVRLVAAAVAAACSAALLPAASAWADTPVTVPTITAPVAGSTVGNAVVITATSTAPKVRFFIDGGFGIVADVSGGTASGVWESWGLADGPHTLTATDCDEFLSCSTTMSAPVDVILSNEAPVITFPTAGATVSGGVTVTATSAGGGLAFFLDGTEFGFATAAPYAASHPGALSEGSHTVQVLQCSADANLCFGPSSDPVTFQAKYLRPTILGLAPNPFSPNGDGRLDRTVLSYALPDTETVTVRVTNSSGVTVRGPLPLGTRGAGTYSWTWDGKRNDLTRAPDGGYRITLTTTAPFNGTIIRGSASRAVGLDTVAPTMSAITGNGATFYPYPDGYKDTFTPTVTLNAGGVLTLTIYNAVGKTLRTLSKSTTAGKRWLTWDGRTASGVRVGAGTYRWRYTIRDAVGNLRVSALYPVYVSGKKLTAKTVVLQQNATAALTYSVSPDTAGCWGWSKSDSAFAPYGMWMGNRCSPGFIGMFYKFTLPAAYQYKSVRLEAYGRTGYPPSRLRGMLRNYSTGQGDVYGGSNAGSTTAWYWLGTAPAASHVSGRVVEPGIVVTSVRGRTDSVRVRLQVPQTDREPDRAPVTTAVKPTFRHHLLWSVVVAGRYVGGRRRGRVRRARVPRHRHAGQCRR